MPPREASSYSAQTYFDGSCECAESGRVAGWFIGFLLLTTSVTGGAQTFVSPFDPAIAPGCGTPTYPSAVFAAAEQADGRIILAGCFQSIEGQTRINVARLLPDGALDAGLDPRPNGPVFTIVVAPDGKILLGGDFTTVQPGRNGAPISRRGLFRLMPNGDLDPSFDPSFRGPQNNFELVRAIEYFDDNRILVGGNFTSIQPHQTQKPTARFRLARLQIEDGSLDVTLDARLDRLIYTMQREKSGAFLIGGMFGSFQQDAKSAPLPRAHLLQLDANGQLDPSFTVSPNGPVWSIAQDIEERILLGGEFTGIEDAIGGPASTRLHFARLNANGDLDNEFRPDPRLPGGERIGIYGIQPTADSSMRIAGIFNQMESPLFPPIVLRSSFARILATGQVSTSFDPHAGLTSGSVLAGYGLLQMRSGAILINGTFNTLRPDLGNTIELRNFLAAIEAAADGRRIEVLSTDRVCLRWGDTDALPQRVWFETSVDGSIWLPLGTANLYERNLACSTGRSLDGATQVQALSHTRTGVFNNSLSLARFSAIIDFSTLPPIFRDGFE